MKARANSRVAILYPGDREVRRQAVLENSRFANLAQALLAKGLQVEPAIYQDDFCDEVREQLMGVDGVLVWVNPIERGRDRSMLDAMLREVATSGIFVSTHPDIVLLLGTKEVIYRTKNLGWGCDTHLYDSMAMLRENLPARLSNGRARVLKQNRGNGGDGVWKVQFPPAAFTNLPEGTGFVPQLSSRVRVRHAKRGCVEEEITLEEFFQRCEIYFAGMGRIIDQEYQERLPEGMIRCYLVHDVVAGFGHQAVNALYPAPAGAFLVEAPQPGPRFYHPPDKPEFQVLRRKLESEWVPAMQQLLDIPRARLPVLWDCDFLLGPVDGNNEDRYVLCEINVSSVAPYPESMVSYVADAMVIALK